MEALMIKNGPRDQFKSVLKSLEKKLRGTGGKLTLGVNSVTWPFLKQEIKEILSEQERVKLFFVLALEFASLYLSLHLPS